MHVLVVLAIADSFATASASKSASESNTRAFESIQSAVDDTNILGLGGSREECQPKGGQCALWRGECCEGLFCNEWMECCAHREPVMDCGQDDESREEDPESSGSGAVATAEPPSVARGP